MKVVVTGAMGRLGLATCKVLADAGVEFLATDRIIGDPGYHVRVADLLDREICYELVDGVDAVVHLGNYSNQHLADAQTVFNENCAMNMNIFQAAYERGVRKIVFASSIQAMTGVRSYRDGEPPASSLPYLPVDGDVPANPGNHYAASKEASEILLRYFSKYHQISGIAIRFPMLLGANTFASYRQPIEHARNAANLDECFSILSMPDAGRLILAVLKATLPGFRIYLPAAKSPWVKAPVSEIINRFFPGVPLRKPLAAIDSLIDISRIRSETGWTPIDEPVIQTPSV